MNREELEVAYEIEIGPAEDEVILDEVNISEEEESVHTCEGELSEEGDELDGNENDAPPVQLANNQGNLVSLETSPKR